VIDFVGKVDGVAFDGGTGEDMSVELGSGQLIPGFEEQLVGVKAGDKREVNVTFPADYQAANLKGKAATFASGQGGEDRRRDQGRRRVRQVARPQGPRPAEGPDPRPAAAGTERPDPHAHEAPLLDQLARAMISRCRRRWSRPNMRTSWPSFATKRATRPTRRRRSRKSRSDAAEYRNIAERRVRLGLLLSEIGAANGVEVSSRK
jgi:trigger factor